MKATIRNIRLRRHMIIVTTTMLHCHHLPQLCFTCAFQSIVIYVQIYLIYQFNQQIQIHYSNNHRNVKETEHDRNNTAQRYI